MLAPSQYASAAQARIAEVEAEARFIESSAMRFSHEAGSFRNMARFYAAMADDERTERIKERIAANTISHALRVLEVALPDEITDEQFACFFDFLTSKMAEREKPVAWARKGLNMEGVVIELEEQMRSALENDGYIMPPTLDDAADRVWEQRMV